VSAAPRQELTAAVLGALGAGALALIAGGQAWAQVTAEREAPLPPVTDVLTGAAAAPLVPAAGLVLLAAGVALLAVRGLGRAVVGLLMAVAGGVLAWSGVRAFTGGLEAAAQEFASRSTVTTEISAAWPVLAVLAGALGAAAGLLAVLRGRTWPAMGRRYERAGATAPGAAGARRPETDEDRAQAAWKALDRGEDPTSDPTNDPTNDPNGPAPVRDRP
jgi:uncharacterized membrane protein (TIGR02234 family)